MLLSLKMVMTNVFCWLSSKCYYPLVWFPWRRILPRPACLVGVSWVLWRTAFPALSGEPFPNLPVVSGAVCSCLSLCLLSPSGCISSGVCRAEPQKRNVPECAGGALGPESAVPLLWVFTPALLSSRRHPTSEHFCGSVGRQPAPYP